MIGVALLRQWVIVWSALLALSSPASARSVTLASPNARAALSLSDSDTGPRFALAYNTRPILAPSPLGFQFEQYRKLGPKMHIVEVGRSSGVDRYELRTGRASRVADAYNALNVVLADDGPGRVRLTLELRAYDDGVALRYRVDPQPNLHHLRIFNELTAFAFPADYRCWGFNVGHFGSSHEGEFDPVLAHLIRPHNLYDRPLTCTTGDAWFQISEANLHEYAGMYLSGLESGELGVQVRLSPRRDDPSIAVDEKLDASPLVTPWRLITLGDSAGSILQSTLATSLNRPASGNFDWVEPGKYVWDWWSGPTLAAVPSAGMNNATIRTLIDFAATSGFRYMLIDDGWYRNSGSGSTVLPAADATQPIPALDLPGLVAYARNRNVGLWTWVHWKLLDADMDGILGYLEKTGIRGIKVDFMDRDDQQMVAFYDRLMAATAEHHLMLDLHGAYPPTGAIRTWPNFLTQEGVMGAEYNKWTKRITAHHNVMVAYTRGALGPMDYTPGGFDNVSEEAFKPRVAPPMVQTTRGQALAMYILFESAFQGVVDTPDNYRTSKGAAPGFDFLRIVPVSWDETRFLKGAIGKYIVLARRKGENWYIGAMTDDQGRTIKVPLNFLTQRGHAKIWEDGGDPKSLRIRKEKVAPQSTLSLTLSPSGGAAVMLTPDQ